MYACAGSFSFPAVPPNSHLEYEVELLDWEPASEEPPREQMLWVLFSAVGSLGADAL